jgi:hypothetical protein
MLIYHASTAAEAMHPVKFGEAFRPKIHQLRAEAAKIKTDLSGDQLLVGAPLRGF